MSEAERNLTQTGFTVSLHQALKSPQRGFVKMNVFGLLIPPFAISLLRSQIDASFHTQRQTRH